MFYSEFVLAKKGALGKIWLAAHWEKKLTRNQISKSNIVDACNSIIKPVAPLALRTSGHLLLGVVRIHDGKQKSLMHDCSDALVKIKLAFRPGNVDLPADRVSVNYNSITQGPEDLDADFADEFPAVEDDSVLNETQLNVGTMEQITMQEFDPIVNDVIPAPEMDGFGDDAIAPGEISDIRGEDEMEIELGREALATEDPYQPNETTMDASRADDDTTLDNTALDVSQIPNDFEQPPMIEDDFGEDQPIEPVDASTIGGDTIIEEVEEVDLLNVSEVRPLEPVVKESNASTLKLSRRKRKLVVDDKSVEIPSAEIKRNLQPDGCDDILKQPYSEAPRQMFVFKRAPYSRKGVKQRLKNLSPEAMFNRPVSGRWGPHLMKVWQRSKNFKATDAMMASSEEVELGRRNASPEKQDQLGLDETLDQLPQDELPELPQDDQLEFEQPIMDDPSINATLDNTAGDSRLDDTSMGPVDSILFDEPNDEVQVSASEYSQQDHLTRRTAKMMTSLRAGFESTDSLSFESMTHKKSKRTAAACFFELLVLKTKDYVDIKQRAPYEDITITPMDSLIAV